MLSTSTSFLIVNRDLQASLKRVAGDPIVSRDAEYYRENISKVTSVDAFVDDYRLFSYSMKAYGLEDMTYAKAFMKKVLASDLSDDKSFANKLADKRYRDFAAAFNFGTDGKLRTTPYDPQSEIQEDDTIGLYTQGVKDNLAAVDTETAYYKATIDSIGSVDELLSNSRLMDFVLKASNIDPAYYSADTVRKVLESDLTDPDSYVNQLGSQNYTGLAEAFSFNADGSVDAGVSPQTADQKAGIVADYGFFVADGTTPQAAQDNTDYFTTQTAALTSVDDLLDDGRLYNYLLTAFGFSTFGTDKNAVRQALLSDPNDPGSFANTQEDTNFSRLAGIFNFAADGSLPVGKEPQSEAQRNAVTGLYLEHYDDALETSTDKDTAYFQAASGTIKSVDDLLGDVHLYAYVLGAYGLDPDTESTSKIRRILTSDPSDPASYVNRLHDSRYAKLAEAFNFNADGSIGAPDVAQTTAEAHELETAYAALVSAGSITRDEAKTETSYYEATIGTVDSLDAFLADKRLVSFALKAGGLDPTTVDTATLRLAFVSDLDDPQSFANAKADPKLRNLVARFNFRPDGSIAARPADTAQSHSDVLATADLYLRQTLEENEGAENTGVRLALYFERTAPGIASVYDILADPALQQVVQTALGLAPESSAADIDLQAKFIEDQLDIADFKDPDKLQAFLGRFTSMYDAVNSTASNPALTLLSGASSSVGISADLMLNIAQLRTGGIG